jgi:hypothetical protein
VCLWHGSEMSPMSAAMNVVLSLSTTRAVDEARVKALPSLRSPHRSVRGGRSRMPECMFLVPNVLK